MGYRPRRGYQKRNTLMWSFVGLLIIFCGLPFTQWAAENWENAITSSWVEWENIDGTQPNDVIWSGYAPDYGGNVYAIATWVHYNSTGSADTDVLDDSIAWYVNEQKPRHGVILASLDNDGILTDGTKPNELRFVLNGTGADDLYDNNVERLAVHLNTTRGNENYTIIVQVLYESGDGGTYDAYADIAQTTAYVPANNKTTIYIYFDPLKLSAAVQNYTYKGIVVKIQPENYDFADGDVVYFDIDFEKHPDHPLVLGYHVLELYAFIMGLFLFFVAAASTDYFNPLSKDDKIRRWLRGGVRRVTGRKSRRKKSRKSRKKRRRR